MKLAKFKDRAIYNIVRKVFLVDLQRDIDFYVINDCSLEH